MNGGLDPRGRFDALTARDLACESMGWTAGAPLSEGLLHTASLAGGTIDGIAQHMTDLTVGPGVANAHTRLPMTIDAGQKTDAARLCAALNADGAGGTVWIDAAGTPGATICMALSGPESSAAAGIVHAVQRSRALARLVHPCFAGIVAGLTAARALDTCPGCAGFLDALPVATPGTRFVFDIAPDPTSGQIAEAARALAQGGGCQAEVEALARHQALVHAQAGAGLPLCAGPVLFHADGVVECFGCTEPLTRLHGCELTGSCGPLRQVGVGHSCERCATGALAGDGAA